MSNFWHAELILAAKEQNKSAHSSGRKNAMQMLLEAKDEDGAMVREAHLQLFPSYKGSSMLVLQGPLPDAMYGSTCSAIGCHRERWAYGTTGLSSLHAPNIASSPCSLPWIS